MDKRGESDKKKICARYRVTERAKTEPEQRAGETNEMNTVKNEKIKINNEKIESLVNKFVVDFFLAPALSISSASQGKLAMEKPEATKRDNNNKKKLHTYTPNNDYH